MTRRYQSLVLSLTKCDLIHTKLILCLDAAYTPSKTRGSWKRGYYRWSVVAKEEKKRAAWCRVPPIAREGLNAASRCERINHLRSRIS